MKGYSSVSKLREHEADRHGVRGRLSDIHFCPVEGCDRSYSFGRQGFRTAKDVELHKCSAHGKKQTASRKRRNGSVRKDEVDCLK